VCAEGNLTLSPNSLVWWGIRMTATLDDGGNRPTSAVPESRGPYCPHRKPKTTGGIIPITQFTGPASARRSYYEAQNERTAAIVAFVPKGTSPCPGSSQSEAEFGARQWASVQVRAGPGRYRNELDRADRPQRRHPVVGDEHSGGAHFHLRTGIDPAFRPARIRQAEPARQRARLIPSQPSELCNIFVAVRG